MLASIKILAVEDHGDTRKLLKIFLEWSGPEVTAVESGPATLEDGSKLLSALGSSKNTILRTPKTWQIKRVFLGLLQLQKSETVFSTGNVLL